MSRPIINSTLEKILQAIEDDAPRPLVNMRDAIEQDLSALLQQAGKRLEESRGQEKNRTSAADNYIMLNDCLLVFQHWADDVTVNGKSPLFLLENSTSDIQDHGTALRTHFQDILQDIHGLLKDYNKTRLDSHGQQAKLKELKEKFRRLGSFVAPLRGLLESKEDPELKNTKKIVTDFLLTYNEKAHVPRSGGDSEPGDITGPGLFETSISRDNQRYNSRNERVAAGAGIMSLPRPSITVHRDSSHRSASLAVSPQRRAPNTSAKLSSRRPGHFGERVEDSDGSSFDVEPSDNNEEQAEDVHGSYPRPRDLPSITTEPPRSHEDALRRRPQRSIDWRHEICTFLQMPHDVHDDDLFDALCEASDNLREMEVLKSEAAAQRKSPRFQIIYKVSCYHNPFEQGDFLDPPTVVNYGPHEAHARSSRRIPNMEVFLERNKEVTFLVYREYECCGKVPPKKNLLHQEGTDELDAKGLLVREHIEVISPDLRKTMITLGAALKDIPFPDLSQKDTLLRYPYPWWFHQSSRIETIIATMQPDAQGHIEVFTRYLLESLDKEWEVVSKLLTSLKITMEYLHYLFVPNEVVISRSSGSDSANLQGFLLRNWAEIMRPEGEDVIIAQLDVRYWAFDGTFERKDTSLYIDKVPSELEEFAISDLTIYPQRFASQETVSALRERGEMFWKCRKRHYVHSTSQSDYGLQNTMNSRFMVDMMTYNEMHPRDHPRAHQNRDTIGFPLMNEDHPNLGDDFFMCLPTTIKGFNMQKKEWVILMVADIQDVQWDEDAFNQLVIDRETKELIEAAVTSRLLAEEHTDLIRGKGNGLLILLHGGPGTGKTLTAESVAEVAKRPLYRVTCGDIGTKADEVERYLESVLTLGKVWECVVLLDEADVFLEKRSLHHLERNALVSVFLRALEYYDGILILTTNRVGTFDEAFKSRIQFSLRYNNLVPGQRRQIWDNFIKRLETVNTVAQHGGKFVPTVPRTRRNINVGIDSTDVRKHLDELAVHELNGREIRNAISTARQLAMFRGEPMKYVHLQRVIGEANKFQEYLRDLNQGLTADEISRELGER